MEALKKQFSPEFLNRVDEFIVFHQLTRAELFRIVEIMVDQVRNRLGDRAIGIELTEARRPGSSNRGTTPSMGRGRCVGPSSATWRTR